MFTPSGVPRRAHQRRHLRSAVPASSNGRQDLASSALQPSFAAHSREFPVDNTPSAANHAFVLTIRKAGRQIGALAAIASSLLKQTSMHSGEGSPYSTFRSSLETCNDNIRELNGLMDELLRLLEQHTITRRETGVIGPQRTKGLGATQTDSGGSEREPGLLLPCILDQYPQDGPSCDKASAAISTPNGARIRSTATSFPGTTGSDSDSDVASDCDSVINSDLDSEPDSDDDDPGCDSTNKRLRNDPDFINQLIVDCAVEGPTMANRGESAQRMTRTAKKNWQLFCKHLNREKPDETLRQCHAPTFKAYLYWLCTRSKSRIKKESSITTYWKVLSMYYCDATNSWMEGAVLLDVGNWITAKLSPWLGLDTSTKIKAGLYVADLDLMLHHLWVLDEQTLAHERLRAQLAEILVLAGATSTRPSALIEHLRYKDVEFHVFPPAPGSKRARIGMVVWLNKMKRTAGKSRRRGYGFHEEDTLLHDPVLYMQALAFADQAFESNFQVPEDIYNLVVPPNSDRIILPWKAEWRDKPVFRAIQGRGAHAVVALDKALQYAKARQLLIHLGRALGYEKQLEWYDLRRGTGKKLNKALPPEERNHSMGHAQGDSSTYQRFYMTDYNEGVDFQEIVFGSTPQRDLIHLMGRLTRHGDAPKRLNDRQRSEVNESPMLAKLRRKRDRVLEKINNQGWNLNTIKSANSKQASELEDQYRRYDKQMHSLRQSLQEKRLARAIHEFHDSVHVGEISRQLNGVRPAELLAPPEIQYQLPSRGEIARLFSIAVGTSNEDELHLLRVSLVKELALLCKQKQLPCGRHTERTSKAANFKQPVASNRPVLRSDIMPLSMEESSATHSETPPRNALISCPLCEAKESEGSIPIHIRDDHLTEPKMFRCPYKGCPAIISGARYFSDHCRRQHSYD